MGVARLWPQNESVWDFGSQLDAWASGLGHWEVCGLDDDDGMYEPDAWRHSEALDDWDA